MAPPHAGSSGVDTDWVWASSLEPSWTGCGHIAAHTKCYVLPDFGIATNTTVMARIVDESGVADTTPFEDWLW